MMQDSADPPLNSHQRKHLGKLFPLVYPDWKHVTVAERAGVTTSAQSDSLSHGGTAFGNLDPSQNQLIDLSDVSLARGTAPTTTSARPHGSPFSENPEEDSNLGQLATTPVFATTSDAPASTGASFDPGEDGFRSGKHSPTD